MATKWPKHAQTIVVILAIESPSSAVHASSTFGATHVSAADDEWLFPRESPSLRSSKVAFLPVLPTSLMLFYQAVLKVLFGHRAQRKMEVLS